MRSFPLRSDKLGRYAQAGDYSWPTPLIRLSSFGAEVVVKREGRRGSGSFYDRVAAAQLEAVGIDQRLALLGWTSHTLAVLALSKLSGHSVVVIDDKLRSRRLRGLGFAYGAEVMAGDGDCQVQGLLSEALDSGARLLRPDEPRAIKDALGSIAAELGGQGVELAALGLIAMPSLGVELSVAAASLGVSEAQLETPDVASWDLEPVELSESVAAVRSQLATREGLLVSPSGAAVVARALEFARATTKQTLAILIEDGHRHLGWW